MKKIDGNQTRKHAYLIMVHHNFKQLLFLISLLDDVRNDIYLHIDKKIDKEAYTYIYNEIQKATFNSKIYFVDRIAVYWGHYSQIEAECSLFKASSSNYEYSYYHLISGDDLPLVSQDAIHQFFNQHPNKLFLKKAEITPTIYERVAFPYIFPRITERTSKSLFFRICYRIFRKLEKSVYRILKVDCFKKFGLELGKASNWVSIDNRMVKIILENEELVKQIFEKSFCGDELFIPTLVNHYDLVEDVYYYEIVPNAMGEFQGHLRYINWWDGNPYVWTDSEKDKSELLLAKKNGHFFSRKFDCSRYPKSGEFVLKLIEQDNFD
ncbi:TPA: beta-1,6-N-acetylglucosaminyltransferase [Streptococcus suis]